MFGAGSAISACTNSSVLRLPRTFVRCNCDACIGSQVSFSGAGICDRTTVRCGHDRRRSGAGQSKSSQAPAIEMSQRSTVPLTVRAARAAGATAFPPHNEACRLPCSSLPIPQWKQNTCLFVLAGALAGGFVNGLAGFGTGITALGLWLYVLSPSIAATLVVVCSAAAQLQTLPRVWRAVNFSRVAPFILPGLIGVPLGTQLLAHIDVRTFKLGIAGLLIGYAAYSLLLRRNGALAWGGRTADGDVSSGSAAE